MPPSWSIATITSPIGRERPDVGDEARDLLGRRDVASGAGLLVTIEQDHAADAQVADVVLHPVEIREVAAAEPEDEHPRDLLAQRQVASDRRRFGR